MQFANKTILVTGASSGLGSGMARFLAKNGALVVAAARRRQALQALAEKSAGRIRPLEMDVSQPESLAQGVAFAAAQSGRIDGLVNNAGVAWGGKALAMPGADWDRVIDVNLSAVFKLAQLVARSMAETGGGAIVNIASILGFGTGQGVAAYATSKAGVVHLTRSLALEWARHGIRVNAIAPGYFPTEMTGDFLESEEGQAVRTTVPMRRFGQIEDLHGPLELLLSEKGAYMTGVTLPVDGGHLVRPL